MRAWVALLPCLLLTASAGAFPSGPSSPDKVLYDGSETLRPSSAAQVLFGPSQLGEIPVSQTAQELEASAEDPADDSFLDWERPPDPDATDHHIFNAANSLLQRWPNILRRNGHSIVPATMPAGTTLYHGRTNAKFPTIPEWLAFDFEHAYMFCRGPCYVLTLQTTRALRLVYFDGTSAGNMRNGTLDTQDVLLWGAPRPDKWLAEWERITALCDWGRPLGLDGFVRMEFHFEVMLCDVSAGTRTVSLLDLLPKNTTVPPPLPGTPRRPPRPPTDAPWPDPLPPQTGPPPGWRGSLPDRRAGYEVNLAGSWHDRAPGETRVVPDPAGLVTFYDPALASLVPARRRRGALHHRLLGVSPADAARVRAELEDVLTRRAAGSGVDWRSVLRGAAERYAGRLEHLRAVLTPGAGFPDAQAQAAAARAQLLVMLAPHLTTADVPGTDGAWAARVVQRCAAAGVPRAAAAFTPQEARLARALGGTLREVCRRLVRVWRAAFDVEGAGAARAREVVSFGRAEVDALMAWLDWPEWVRCAPGCALGELYYVPTWPFRPGDNMDDMTPRCLSREDMMGVW
ncbi:hypothetical protein BC834DRAFT_529914 [Gloeopeniophorella convolvens]|nr:hypothetical protein BC834DRAFT_529914 [Gloeopeniophorella convolvens]